MSAEKIKVLTFETPSKIGTLAEISKAIADEGLNITGICAYEKGKKGYFVLVTDNVDKAKKTLNKIKVKAKTETAISITAPNKPGELAKIAQSVASSKINIIYCFATALPEKDSSIILKTSNDGRALKVLGEVKKPSEPEKETKEETKQQETQTQEGGEKS